MKRSLLTLLAILAFTGLAACSPAVPSSTAAMPAPPTETTSAPDSKALPPDLQVVRIPSANGMQLEGRYYPGAADPSPLVVLMHWAPGSQDDWSAIASWLQNRGQTITPGSNPWQKPDWFPAVPAGRSYAVLTFTFSRCENGCQSFSLADRQQWLEDAYAVAVFAPTLPGVDPARIVFVGASMGSDGAVDACGRLNSLVPGSCKGAFSLSPGGYLTLPYDSAVTALQTANPPVPARCLYAIGDTESAAACKAASGPAYQAQEYPGSDHAMQLIKPESDPQPLDLLLDFLAVLE